MKVQALDKGYDGRIVREKGEVFEFEGKLGSWMKPVGGAKAAALAAPKGEEDLGDEGSDKSGSDEQDLEAQKAGKAAEAEAKKAAKAAEKAAKKAAKK